MRGISRTTSSHSHLVEFLSMMLKRRELVAAGTAAVPHSKRLLVKWSSIAARSALRTGWSFRGERLMMPEREVDVLGLRGDVPHHDLGRRHVAVLGERVVLAQPRVLPVVLVGEDHVLGFAARAPRARLGLDGPRVRGCTRSGRCRIPWMLLIRGWRAWTNVLMVPLKTCRRQGPTRSLVPRFPDRG